MKNPQLKGNQILQNFILLFSVLLLIASCCKHQTATHENVEETVIALESEALDQWASGNPLGFIMHAAEDATYFDDIGAFNRISGMENIEAYLTALEGQIPPHEYEIVDPIVQVYGDIAILTFQYHSRIDTMSGQPWKATSVYHFNDSIWLMVHANWSLVKSQ